MNHILDEKDRKILELLKESSNLSTHKISKKTLIPITTVNNRIKRLKKEGIIKKYTIEVDNKKLGIGLSAYIFVQSSLKELKENKLKISELVKEIRQSRSVEFADNVTGNIDIVVKVNVKDIDELNNHVLNRLTSLQGVEKTVTAIILEHD